MARRIPIFDAKPRKPLVELPKSSPEDRTDEKRERNRFYAGTRWRRLRARFLADKPLCAHCLARGLVVRADAVHHRIERLSDPKLAYQRSNLEGLCTPCHTRHHNRDRSQARGSTGLADPLGFPTDDEPRGTQ